MTRNLLVVSWCMPPLLLPRSIQVSRLLCALLPRGWQPTVLCADPLTVEPGIAIDHGLEQRYCRGYEILRVPLASPGPVAYDALRSQWLRPAVHAATVQLERRGFAALLTFAQPWVDHLVGLELRRAQQLPWLAHFSDPWVDSPYYRRLARAQRARWREQEEAVLREADLIVFTTPQTADLVMRKYPAPWAHKVRVIPHGYDPAPTAAAASDTASTSDCLRLVHTGDLYGERGPLGLFQALRRLVRTGTLPARVELVLVGRSSPEHRQAATELGIEHLVHFHEPQPYADSVRMAAGADVLVVIDAPSNQPSPFLPSKLVDYLMLRKPILGLTPTRGATADLLQRLGCLMAAPDDVPAIARNLVALAAARRDGRLEISPGFERVAREYELAEIARVFDGALAALVASAT